MKENRKPNTSCIICGKQIYRRPSDMSTYKTGAYCSKECFFNAHRKVVKCPICYKDFNPATNKQKTCSRSCSNKSRAGIKYNQGTENSRDKSAIRRRLKRILMETRGPRCELCGHDNLNILQVHHIVEVSEGGSDELDNLKLICPNCHCTIHYGDSRTNASVAEMDLASD